MFNLLPDNLRKKIKFEYRLRLVVIVLVSIIITQIFFLIMLFPSWLISLGKEKEIALQTKNIDKLSTDSKVKEVNSTVQLINTRLEAINSVLEYPEITPLINGILSKKTSSIHIKEIAYISSNKTEGEVILAGTSSTRESLTSFVKKLEDSKLFNSVNLPISNFTKDKNLDFSISMAIVSQHVQR
jgi:hypothetical protein